MKMLQINVDIDEKKVRRYSNRGSALHFGIHWAYRGEYYPDEYWQDFGCVLLSWWCITAVDLINGAFEADFRFMEGPLRMHISHSGEKVEISAVHLSEPWQVSLIDVTTALIITTEDMIDKLKKMDLPDTEGLHRCLLKLKTAKGDSVN